MCPSNTLTEQEIITRYNKLSKTDVDKFVRDVVSFINQQDINHGIQLYRLLQDALEKGETFKIKAFEAILSNTAKKIQYARNNIVVSILSNAPQPTAEKLLGMTTLVEPYLKEINAPKTKNTKELYEYIEKNVKEPNKSKFGVGKGR